MHTHRNKTPLASRLNFWLETLHYDVFILKMSRKQLVAVNLLTHTQGAAYVRN